MAKCAASTANKEHLTSWGKEMLLPKLSLFLYVLCMHTHVVCIKSLSLSMYLSCSSAMGYANYQSQPLPLSLSLLFFYRVRGHVLSRSLSLSFFRSGYGGPISPPSGLRCPARVGHTRLYYPSLPENGLYVLDVLWGPYTTRNTLRIVHPLLAVACKLYPCKVKTLSLPASCRRLHQIVTTL